MLKQEGGRRLCWAEFEGVFSDHPGLVSPASSLSGQCSNTHQNSSRKPSKEEKPVSCASHISVAHWRAFGEEMNSVIFSISVMLVCMEKYRELWKRNPLHNLRSPSYLSGHAMPDCLFLAVEAELRRPGGMMEAGRV